jgi:predicted MarR family transcription regulator
VSGQNGQAPNNWEISLIVGTTRQSFVDFNMAVLSALGAEVFSPSKENELSDLGHYITTHDTRMIQYAYDDILKADLMEHTVGLLNLPS